MGRDPLVPSGRARRWSRLSLVAAVIGALLVGSVPALSDSASAAPDDENLIGITAALNSTASRPSGSTWQYLISVSCSAAAGSNCTGLQVTIPIPQTANAQTGVAGAWTTWATPTVAADSTLLGGSTSKSVTVSGGNWVLPLSRALTAGEVQVLTLSVTVPNYTTPNGFTWQLQPSVSASNAGTATATADPTGAATATATAQPCGVAVDTITGPVGSTRSASRTWYFARPSGGVTNGSLGVAPGTTTVGTMTYPEALSFVANTATTATDFAHDAAGRTLTYSSPVTTAGAPTITATPSFLLLGPPGTYTVTYGGSYVPLGATEPVTCTATSTVTITSDAITGTIWTKSARGFTPTGDSYGGGVAGTSGTAYAPASQEGLLGLGSSFWSLQINRKEATLQDVHLFDGMPCLASGSGTSAADPYLSLTEADAPCPDPAFHLKYVFGYGGMLDDQKVTFEYTDGTSAVITPQLSGFYYTMGYLGNCSASYVCYVPDASKTVASLIIDGSYNVNDASTDKSFVVFGSPVSTLPTSQQWYVRNAATASGANFPASTVSAGMVTPPRLALLSNYGRSNTYTYTPTWTGSQQHGYCAYTWSSTSQCLWAYTSDPAAAPERRTAIIVPSGSGINVTQVRVYGPDAISASAPTVTATTGDYGGFGPGASRYLIDASQINGAPVGYALGVGAVVSYGGMQPGVYQYYTYTGFTGTDPTDGGAQCRAGGGTVVTDTTGIIGEPGVPRVLCRATNTITVTSPAAAINLTKQVRNVTAGSEWVGAPSAVVAEPGDAIQFRIRVSNTGPAALTNVALYDLLPRSGDTGIIASKVTQSRGSTGDVPLAALPDSPAGWNLAYSASTNPCRPEVGIEVGAAGCANDWSASAAASDVRAVRLTIASLAVATTATPYHEFTLSYTVPSAPTWGAGDVEWNSVAAGGTYQALTLSPAETDKVGFTSWPGLFLSKLGGDLSGGSGLAGSEWSVLSDDDGSPGAKDPAITVTPLPDQTGLFHLAGIRAPGTYWLMEAKAPDAYTLLAQPVQFTVSATGGVTLGAGASANIVASQAPVPGYTQDQALLTVRDARALMLPMTGGRGALVFWALGAALLATAIIMYRRRGPVG